MAKRKEKFEIVFVKERGRLIPATAMDQEEVNALAEGTQVKVTPDDTRGHAQLGFYWLVLKHVVDATGRWPTKEKLHDAVKRALGYVHVAATLTGQPYVAVDSISLADMTDDERKVFMKQAFAEIGAATGIDPISLVPERRQAA